MHAKKRFLVATFGAVVALTVQTPVSAYIAKAREAASHRYFGSSHPPSYLIDAFKDAGQRVLNADSRWNGWRASTPGGTLAADDGASDRHSGRFDSTLGEIDLHRLAETTHGQNGSSSGGSSSGEWGEGAHASAIGGNGGRGYGGGGAGGSGGGGGGGGYGSRGGEGNNGWHNASFDGTDGPNGHGGGTEVFTSGSGGLFDHNWGGNWGSNGSGSDDSNFCDNGHGGGGVGENAVPEPTTLLFLAGGLAGLAARRRRNSLAN
jgi:hypothetical protein